MRLSCRARALRCARRRVIVYAYFSDEIIKEVMQQYQNYCLPMFSGEIRKEGGSTVWPCNN
jgi:hypothetical protein